MKPLIRLLYTAFRPEIEALLIEDLLMQMPGEVSKPFLELMAARKAVALKWIQFEVNSIMTRPPIHNNNPERRQGMLLIMQALYLAIGGTKAKTEVIPGGQEIPARAEPPERNNYQAGIRSFADGVKARFHPEPEEGAE